MITNPTRHPSLGLVAVMALVLAVTGPPAAPAGELAEAMVYSGGVDIRAHYAYSQAFLTVAGGDVVVERVLQPGDDLSVELFDLDGEYLPDGVYNWELRLVPTPELARELRLAATLNGGEATDAWLPETGTFAIVDGQVASPDATEPGPPRHASGLDSGLRSQGTVSSFRRAEAAVDDDAAVGSRKGVEAALRRSAPALAGDPGGNINFERSDAGALALGGTLEPARQFDTHLNGARSVAPPARRTIDPDGKHGRPTSKDQVR